MTVRKAVVLNGGQLELQQSGDLIAGVANVLTNTTLYVATTGDDTTGDGSSGNPWLTIGKALSYLTDKWIDKSQFVTISVGDGNFPISTSLTVNHPHGDRLTITGTNTHDKTLSNVQSSSGSAGAWSYILNVNNVTDLAVDDYVIIRSATGGTNPTFLVGCHQITNVDAINSRITVAVKHKHTSVASGSVTGTVTCVKTRITVTGTDGLIVTPHCSLSFIDKIVMAGDATAGKTGFLLTYGTAAASGGSIAFGNAVASVNFTYGVQCVGGTVIGGVVCSGNGASGIQLFDGGRLYASLGVRCTGNGAFGVFATLNSSAYCPASICTGNSDSGFGASVKGSISGSASTLTGNVLNGAVGEVDGTLLLDLCTITTNLETGILLLTGSNATASSANITSNDAYGVYVNHAYIQINGSTVSGNTFGNYNIPIDQLDLYGSFIDTGGTPVSDTFLTPGGRLTLSSTETVPNGDIGAVTTLYYLSHIHGQVPLYNGSIWGQYAIPGGSISATLPSSGGVAKPTDVWLYLDSGTPALDFTLWSTATARATNIARQSNGLITKSGDATRLYLGTVMLNTSSQSTDQARHRWVWNMYNRVERWFFWQGPSTAWTYSANNVARYVNGGTAPSLSVVTGFPEDLIDCSVHCSALKSAGGGATAVELSIARDATNTTFHTNAMAGVIRSSGTTDTRTTIAKLVEMVPLGYHEYNWTERTGTNAVTLSCQGSNANEGGMIAAYRM